MRRFAQGLYKIRWALPQLIRIHPPNHILSTFSPSRIPASNVFNTSRNDHHQFILIGYWEYAWPGSDSRGMLFAKITQYSRRACCPTEGGFQFLFAHNTRLQQWFSPRFCGISGSPPGGDITFPIYCTAGADGETLSLLARNFASATKKDCSSQFSTLRFCRSILTDIMKGWC